MHACTSLWKARYKEIVVPAYHETRVSFRSKTFLRNILTHLTKHEENNVYDSVQSAFKMVVPEVINLTCITEYKIH
jgi:hypothetical protein